IQRASEVGDGLEDGGENEREHFPVTQMRRDKDDASSLGFGETLACYCFKKRRVTACRQSSVRGPWELSEVGDETAEVVEGLGEQPAPFSDGELRKSHLEGAQPNVGRAWAT